MGRCRGHEARLASFTELVATAIANAESSAELAASRRRIVAASDETRRRIERDLHDGTQQRLVSLGLAVRAVEANLPPDREDLRDELSRVAMGLANAVEDRSHGGSTPRSSPKADSPRPWKGSPTAHRFLSTSS
jgi:signal transduction histidine kinase